MMRALRERSRTRKPPVHGDLPHSKPAASQPFPAQLSMSHQEWLSSGFLGVLIKYDVNGQGLEAYATYLPYIVRLVGTNSALDDAVAVFSTCYAGRPDSTETIRAYGRALRSLRECLSVPQQASSTDTLSAAMLLGLYGSLFPRSRLGVLSHHEGVSKIIQYRGPGRHRTGFEQQLVISHWAANVSSTLAKQNQNPVLTGPRRLCFRYSEVKGAFSKVKNGGRYFVLRLSDTSMNSTCSYVKFLKA